MIRLIFTTRRSAHSSGVTRRLRSTQFAMPNAKNRQKKNAQKKYRRRNSVHSEKTVAIIRTLNKNGKGLFTMCITPPTKEWRCRHSAVKLRIKPMIRHKSQLCRFKNFIETAALSRKVTPIFFDFVKKLICNSPNIKILRMQIYCSTKNVYFQLNICNLI